MLVLLYSLQFVVDYYLYWSVAVACVNRSRLLRFEVFKHREVVVQVVLSQRIVAAMVEEMIAGIMIDDGYVDLTDIDYGYGYNDIVYDKWW